MSVAPKYKHSSVSTKNTFILLKLRAIQFNNKDGTK